MNKLLGMLGLACKAGALSSGTNAAIDALRSGKAVFVIAASDISANTKKLITDKAAYNETQVVFISETMEQLGAAIGKPSTSCVAVNDRNFATAIKNILGTDSK